MLPAMLQSTSPESIGISTPRLERLYALLNEAVNSGAIPGAAIQIGRYGIVLTPRAFGRQFPDSASPAMATDTIFLTASVTKPVTVTAVMLLIEQGAQADFVTRIRLKQAGINERQVRNRAQLVEGGKQRGVSGLFISADVAYQVAA